MRFWQAICVLLLLALAGCTKYRQAGPLEMPPTWPLAWLTPPPDSSRNRLSSAWASQSTGTDAWLDPSSSTLQSFESKEWMWPYGNSLSFEEQKLHFDKLMKEHGWLLVNKTSNFNLYVSADGMYSLQYLHMDEFGGVGPDWHSLNLNEWDSPRTKYLDKAWPIP